MSFGTDLRFVLFACIVLSDLVNSWDIFCENLFQYFLIEKSASNLVVRVTKHEQNQTRTKSRGKYCAARSMQYYRMKYFRGCHVNIFGNPIPIVNYPTKAGPPRS